jgi:hypothetical protein
MSARRPTGGTDESTTSLRRNDQWLQKKGKARRSQRRRARSGRARRRDASASSLLNAVERKGAGVCRLLSFFIHDGFESGRSRSVRHDGFIRSRTPHVSANERFNWRADTCRNDDAHRLACARLLRRFLHELLPRGGEQPLGWRRERSPTADERRGAARARHSQPGCQIPRFAYPPVSEQDTSQGRTVEDSVLCGSETICSDSERVSSQRSVSRFRRQKAVRPRCVLVDLDRPSVVRQAELGKRIALPS